jgi:hypothetical protein
VLFWLLWLFDWLFSLFVLPSPLFFEDGFEHAAMSKAARRRHLN